MSLKGSRKAYCIFHDRSEMQQAMSLAREVAYNSELEVVPFDEQLLQRLPVIGSMRPRSCFLVGDDPLSASKMHLIEKLHESYPTIPSLLVTSADKFSIRNSPLSSAVLVSRPFDELQLSEQINRVFTIADQRSQLISKSQLVDRLSPREVEIVQLATEGVPNKTIARRLDISIKTVEKNRRTAYEKLGVSSAAELASLITFHMFFSEPAFVGSHAMQYG